jgi:ABC-type cobalamin/Fe3+-siderophores transport system ATPase subunit
VSYHTKFLEQHFTHYAGRKAAYEATQAAWTKAAAKQKMLDARHVALDSVMLQVQELALLTQQQCEKTIADLVTRCLQAIFPENKYTFALVFERKREQTEARCVLRDDDGNEYDPVTACGGGVVSIICFALRLATLILRVPQARKLLVLDEPFIALSKEHRGRLVGLLESLANETGFQFIIVTHMPELAAIENVIEL